MKKLIVISVVIAFGIFPFASNAQTFDKYSEMDNVSSVLVTSEMFKLLAEIDYDSSDPEMQQYVNLIENLDNIQVYTTHNAHIGSEMAADVKRYLASNVVNKLMSVNEGEQTVTFYSKPGKSDSRISELLMFMTGKENDQPVTVIMKITGDVDLKQISKLAKDLDVPGANELKKIDEQQ